MFRSCPFFLKLAFYYILLSFPLLLGFVVRNLIYVLLRLYFKLRVVCTMGTSLTLTAIKPGVRQKQ